MNFCVLCNQLCRQDFCSPCDAALSLVELGAGERFRPLPDGEATVLSSFAYRGISRQCILACKSQGFRRLGSALVRRVLGCPLLQELLQDSDVIMPAPSSLWSRWRGSLDVAAMLAEGLGTAADLLVRWPPRALSFRWKKQALLGHSQRRGVFRSHQKIYDASYFAPLRPTPLRSAKLKVLIVDDVVTSGSTLSELAACFGPIDFRYYTLASAFRPGKDYHAEYHRRGIAAINSHDAPGL